MVEHLSPPPEGQFPQGGEEVGGGLREKITTSKQTERAVEATAQSSDYEVVVAGRTG